MTPIVFLDVDGVLWTEYGVGRKVDQILMDRLVSILHHYRAKVCFTASRRILFNCCESFLDSYDLMELFPFYWENRWRTPSLSVTSMRRGLECQTWIYSQRKWIYPACFVDDDLTDYIQPSYLLCRVNGAKGIDAKNLDFIAEKLGDFYTLFGLKIGSL